MRQVKVIFISIFISSFQLFGQLDSITILKTPKWAADVVMESSLMEKYSIDTLRNPFYFEEDFNGDDIVDIVFFVKDKIDNKTGVLIVNGGKNIGFIVGAGKDTAMGSDLFWSDNWFVYRDRYIYNFKAKKKKFIISEPGIELVKDLETSLIVYWDKSKYKTHVKSL